MKNENQDDELPMLFKRGTYCYLYNSSDQLYRKRSADFSSVRNGENQVPSRRAVE